MASSIDDEIDHPFPLLTNLHELELTHIEWLRRGGWNALPTLRALRSLHLQSIRVENPIDVGQLSTLSNLTFLRIDVSISICYFASLYFES